MREQERERGEGEWAGEKEKNTVIHVNIRRVITIIIMFINMSRPIHSKLTVSYTCQICLALLSHRFLSKTIILTRSIKLKKTLFTTKFTKHMSFLNFNIIRIQ